MAKNNYQVLFFVKSYIIGIKFLVFKMLMSNTFWKHSQTSPLGKSDLACVHNGKENSVNSMVNVTSSLQFCVAIYFAETVPVDERCTYVGICVCW